MDLLKVIFMVVNPLLLAFIASVLIGVFMKDVSFVLLVKRVVTLIVFGLSFIAYFYLVYFVKGAAVYFAMFTPLALTLIFIIASIIAAPKDKIKEDSKGDFKMTGWDTMFPNDIDNDRP